MLLNVCERCGKPFRRRRKRQTRCEVCSPITTDPRSTAAYRRSRATILAGDPPCHWCGAPATTADHLIPVADGGSGAPEDLVPSCGRCNSAHGGRQARGSRSDRSREARRRPVPRNDRPSHLRLV